MTELSGTLDGVGLPAIIRFLGGLKKTGCLRIAQDEWHGEIFLDLGQVTGASLGSRHGLSALDGLMQTLPDGSFSFDAELRDAPGATIWLSAEALQAHLQALVVQMAHGTSPLPSFDAVPRVAAQDNASSAEEPLPLDRGTLQTLLVVDGTRTVREIVAQRGSLDALWQVSNLVEVGLVKLSANGVIPSTESASVAEKRAVAKPTLEPSFVEPPATERAAVRPPATRPERAQSTPARPFALRVDADESSVRCSKLGFEDDPNNSTSRPTRLHRCFAAGAPLPLSLDQQRELCLSDQFGTCPRLTMGAFGSPARDSQSAWGEPAARRAGLRRSNPEPKADDSRIVRPPFGIRANAIERGAVADRQAVGDSEPTRFRPASGPARDAAATPATPLRARLERNKGADSTGTIAEPKAAPPQEPRLTEAKPTPQQPVAEPVTRRLGGLPVTVIAGGGVVLVVLAVIAYLVAPVLGDLFVDDSVDTSALPNTSAVAAGTPVAQITAPRTTRAAQPTADAVASETSSTNAAPDAAATANAPAAPTLAPEPTQPAAPAAPAAGTTVLDERFGNNQRNWPSASEGTAFVTNGTYRLVPRQAGQFVAVGAPLADVPKDVVVNATFHKLSGPSGGGYGIIVRDQAPAAGENGTSQVGHYYVVEVGDKGEVGMWRRDGDHWVDLLSWQPNPAVKRDTAANDLSVRVVGNSLSLSVNGTQVASTTDDTFSSGGVGVFAGGDGNQVAVDHFVIQTP